MPDTSSNPAEGAAATALAASPARCLRCGGDLSRLPDEARFCPRCGLDRHTTPPAIFISEPSDEQRGLAGLLGAWHHAAELLQKPGGGPPAPDPIGRLNTSQILEGYANAMYKLGRRYESGGSRGNFREALRCYCKSARLGNVPALARLASSWMRVDPAARDVRPPVGLAGDDPPVPG